MVDEAVIEHVAANHLLLRLPVPPAAEGETSEAAGISCLYGFVPGRQTREGGEMKDLRNGVVTKNLRQQKIENTRRYVPYIKLKKKPSLVLVIKINYFDSSKYITRCTDPDSAKVRISILANFIWDCKLKFSKIFLRSQNMRIFNLFIKRLPVAYFSDIFVPLIISS